MSISEECKRLEEAIQNIEAIKTSGLMPVDKADASIAVLRKQLSLLRETEAESYVHETKTINQDNIFISGGISESILIKGDGNEVNVGLQTIANPDSLFKSYLNYIRDEVGALSLNGIVRQSADRIKSSVNLGSIYIPLLTMHLKDVPEKYRDIEHIIKQEQYSALEVFDQNTRVVLLGPPGSGKSTFINFFALCMVGEVMGDKEANLKTLTAPVPTENFSQQHIQSWQHGALTPVRVVLRDFFARGFLAADKEITAELIWKFIESELHSYNLGEFVPLLKKNLHEKGGAVLFDGLDEVPGSDVRREQLLVGIEKFSAAFPNCRILITSRTYAYHKQNWRLRGFFDVEIAPFSIAQISRFVEAWYEKIAALQNLDKFYAWQQSGALRSAISSNKRLVSLAERPLLLTLIASLHTWRGGSLPDKREQLYEDAIDLLLDRWELQRIIHDPETNEPILQPSLIEWLKSDRKKMRHLLNRLAYDAHATQNELTDTADLPESVLFAELLKIGQNPDVKPVRLIEYLRDRAGLLLPRGIGIYTFPHRTFQEYLAACYLTDHDYPYLIANLVRTDPNRWREVALLVAAKSTREKAMFALWSFVDALCIEDAGHGEKAFHWGIYIAGQAVAENIDKVNNFTEVKANHLRCQMQKVIEGGNLPTPELAQIGRNLSELGDPRFNPNFWYLPNDENMGFVRIPAGQFVMGSDEKDDEAESIEKPQHTVNLPEFWISRYPVTLAQFRAFTQATNYPLKKWEDSAVLSQPVVGVDWQDAWAYAKWLGIEINKESRRLVNAGTSNQLWRQVAKGKLQVSLPSEAEWEKSARGTDARIYPWGNVFLPDRANTAEAGLKDNNTVVGLFPLGASPYGMMDMSGNVWEWTRSFLLEYPHRELWRHLTKYFEIKSPVVVRGGQSATTRKYARCSKRLPCEIHDTGNIGFRLALSPNVSIIRLFFEIVGVSK